MAEDDDCFNTARDAGEEDRMIRFKAIYEATSNPLYVWLGIAYTVGFGEPIPNWCLPYLAECAGAMFNLMSRVIAPEFPIEIKAHDGSRIPIEIDVETAVESVATALKLERQGYNAFKQFMRDEQKRQDAALLDLMVRQAQWRSKQMYDGIPEGMPEEARASLEAHFSQCHGSLEAAETAPQRAIEIIKARRNLDSKRRAEQRVTDGRKLMNPLKPPKPRG